MKQRAPSPTVDTDTEAACDRIVPQPTEADLPPMEQEADSTPAPTHAAWDLDRDDEPQPRKTEEVWLWGGIAAVILLVAMAAAWVGLSGRTAATKQAGATWQAKPPAAPLVATGEWIEPAGNETAVAEEAPHPEEPLAVEAEPPRPAPVARTPEPASAQPPEPVSPQPAVDLEAVPEPTAPIEPAAEELQVVVLPPVEPARLALVVQSSIKQGDLTVFVDGEEIFSAALVAESKGIARVAKKAVRRGRQDLESTLDIEPGEHTVTAQLYSAAKDKVYEDRLELFVDPGGQQTVRIVAGKTFGRKISIKLDD